LQLDLEHYINSFSFLSFSFRFPLSDPETLPLWIAATGREKDWKPCKSSRLCGNHFEKSEYIIGHGKGVLKTKSIPTIEYRTEDMVCCLKIDWFKIKYILYLYNIYI